MDLEVNSLNHHLLFSLMALILIADDRKEDVRDLIEELEYKCHSVVYCGCSRDAQEEIYHGHINFGIFDLIMPRYRGDTEVSADLGGLLLIREAARRLPSAKVALYTSGIEERYQKLVLEMNPNLPIYIKRETPIQKIIDDWRL
jgi:CheY-like chemotaxis protein